MSDVRLQCEAIQKLSAVAYSAGLVIEIGIPEAQFHDVVYAFGLELRPDRESYGSQLPCAWLNGVKLTLTHASPMMKG